MPAQNLTLYAGYTINQYTLKYVDWNGTVLQTASYIYNFDLSSIVEPVVSTRTGYTFTGWNAVLPDNMPAGAITISAIYTINQYTLEYVDWDGTILHTEEYNYNADLSTLTDPDNPNRTGYTFTGWNQSIPSNMPAETVSIIAIYSINQYTLKFVDWNGSILQTTSYAYNSDLSAVTAPANPTRIGYTFLSWNSIVPTNMPATTVTVNALYTINQYTIEYIDWNGVILHTDDYDFNMDLSLVAAPVDPVRTGYTFTGWNLVLPVNMPSSTVSLTATYEINQYTISFDSNGGSFIFAITDTFGSIVNDPSNPEKTGYRFNGWFSNAELTSSYSFTTIPAENIMLYANWDLASYAIEYVDYNGTVLKTGQFDYTSDLSSVTSPSNPSRIGFTFAGWSNSLPFTMPANDVTITATYVINQYSLSYVDWNGTVLQTTNYDYNSELSFVSAPENPSRTGYTFTSWDSLLPVLMPAHSVTLYAIYTDIEVPVISNVENQDVHLSEVLSFEFPVPIVTDNQDTTPEVTVLYFRTDGTQLEDIYAALVEMQNGNNIYAIYCAKDGSDNEAIEVSVIITVIDDISPIVDGVENSLVYKPGDILYIGFNEGTATLNGNPFANGSSVNEIGSYMLEVVDEAGNTTIVLFEIADRNPLFFFILAGLFESVICITTYFQVKKEY